MKWPSNCKGLFYSSLLLAGASGCATVQGGDKPIKVDMTITLKVDQELENFYAFERKYEAPGATSQPATQPTTLPTQS